MLNKLKALYGDNIIVFHNSYIINGYIVIANNGNIINNKICRLEINDNICRIIFKYDNGEVKLFDAEFNRVINTREYLYSYNNGTYIVANTNYIRVYDINFNIIGESNITDYYIRKISNIIISYEYSKVIVRVECEEGSSIVEVKIKQ